MAINPLLTFVGRITAADANYTYGSSKNETAAGAGDGTQYIKARADDIFGFQQALLRLASIVPSNNAETQLASQYLQSLVELASGRAGNYDESGIAGAYVLDIQANQQGPSKYFVGMVIRFTPGNTNPGASTVDVEGLGVKNFKYLDGSAMPSGELTTTNEAVGIYDGAEFIYVPQLTAQTFTDLKSGRRNLLINGNFTINQRGGTLTPGIGVYGFDRWKGHASGIEQVVENVPTGALTLSWTGGGTGSIDGTSGTSPLLVIPATQTNVSIVVPITSTLIQLEAGAIATDFEFRYTAEELALSQRYYQTSGAEEFYGLFANSGAQLQQQTILYPAAMRAVATVTPTFQSGSGALGAVVQNTVGGFRHSFTGTDQQIVQWTWTAEAEL